MSLASKYFPFHFLWGVQALEGPHLHQPQPFRGTPYFSKACSSPSSYLLKFLCTWSVDLLAVSGACTQGLTSLCSFTKSHWLFPMSQGGSPVKAEELRKWGHS